MSGIIGLRRRYLASAGGDWGCRIDIGKHWGFVHLASETKELGLRFFAGYEARDMVDMRDVKELYLVDNYKILIISHMNEECQGFWAECSGSGWMPPAKTID
jgi:hypothetical protein